jgi:predicted pyridoxine 5'-phosphate oxidase superfamily flavin-nucleotide-binding protein
MIATEDDLRRLVPAPPKTIRWKILERLEPRSQHFISCASLVALSSANALTVLVGKNRVTAYDERTLRTDVAVDGAVGGLFVVPGIQETLRINGRATSEGVEVEEVFLQCPKAFVRSKLWDASSWSSESPSTVDAFIERSPFAFIATEGGDGRGDVSPRGDPPGSFVRRIDERTLLVPDRSGNALIDTLRNILVRPRAMMTFVVPGANDVLHVRGGARLTDDKDLLAPSAVKGKAPKVGILIDIEESRLETGTLAGLWNPAELVDPKTFPSFGEMMLDQVNPNGLKIVNKIGAKIFDLGSEYHKRRHLY